MNKPIREEELMRASATEPLMKPAQHFVPNAENSRLFRDALGKFGTGVTIITASGSQGPIGMTANSFASVSLDPALVLWSAARSSGRFEAFADAKHYAIHVLCDEQASTAMDFAKNANAFSSTSWHMGDNNVPLIEGALARFECEQHAVHDGGDHAIIVGRVQRATITEGEGLLFSSGKFGRFTEGM